MNGYLITYLALGLIITTANWLAVRNTPQWKVHRPDMNWLVLLFVFLMWPIYLVILGLASRESR